MKAARRDFHLKSSSSPRGRPCACKIYRNPPEKSLVDYISGLRAFHLGSGVIDVLDGKIQLIIVALGSPQYSVPRSVRTRLTTRSPGPRRRE